MATYAQPGTKRQKVRERIDNVDYFQGVDKVEYNTNASHTDTLTYRYYSAPERVQSRTMEDWLKFSVSLTDFRSKDYTSKPLNRPWDDNSNSLDSHKRCLKALFDLMARLGIKHWTALDSDLVPWTDSWEEYRQAWDDMVEFVQELTQRSHVKLLWLGPDLHSHARYTSGAMTNHDASTFIQVAAQTKKCLEVAQRLNAECFVICPLREGYNSPLQTDVQREMKLFAKLMKMTAEYKERLNYRCQLLIMPYYSTTCNHNRWNPSCNELVSRYVWDVTSCLYFLRSYNLERHYKVCSVPGHHMVMANLYNMLGGVMITNDFYHYDNKKLTLMMKCIVDQGTAPPAGIALRMSPRADSDPRDIASLYVKYVDAVSRALRVAASLLADQLFAKQLQQRYITYQSGFGSRLVSGDVSLEECEEYHKKNQNSEVPSCRSEHWDVVFQRYIDSADQE